jgi:hypothetical protein
MKKTIIILSIFTLIGGCSTPKEAVMPFRNMVDSAEKITPIQNSSAEWIFRVWVNNGTSVDRVITVSKGSYLGKESYIVELGTLYKKRLFREKEMRIYNLISEMPNSGFDNFIQVIDSLGLENYKSQDDFDVVADHNPFSLYIVELKKGNKYHLFRFNTYFPVSRTENRTIDEKYEFIENFLLDEFNYGFYMK